MKRTRVLLVLAAFLLISSVALSPEATMAIQRWVMGGGHEPRSGGSLTINATIGQPAIGRSSAAGLTLSSGYWTGGTSAAAKGYLPLLVKWHS